MKRLLSFLLCFLILCLPMEARRRWIPKIAAAPSFSDIIFYWGMESGTFSNAEKATGSATGTTHGTAAVSLVTVKVGTHSLSCPAPGDYVSFNPVSNFSNTAGGIGFWYQQTGVGFGNFGGLIQIGYSASLSNNALYASTTTGGFVNWQWLAGGSGVAFRTTTGTAMTVTNWYWIQVIQNAGTFTLTVYNSAGSAIQTDSTSGTLGTLAGAIDTFDIGDDNSNAGTQFFDNVLVTNSGTRNLQAINTGTSF